RKYGRHDAESLVFPRPALACGQWWHFHVPPINRYPARYRSISTDQHLSLTGSPTQKNGIKKRAAARFSQCLALAPDHHPRVVIQFILQGELVGGIGQRI